MDIYCRRFGYGEGSMSIRGMHASRVLISLYRGVSGATIPPSSCIFLVLYRHGRVAGRCHATIDSRSANHARRYEHLIEPDHRLAPDRCPASILAGRVDPPRAAVPLPPTPPPALTRPFPPCRVPALAGWRETHFS